MPFSQTQLCDVTFTHRTNSVFYDVLSLQMKYTEYTKEKKRIVTFGPVAFLMTTAMLSSVLGSRATNNLDPDFKPLVSINFERSD